MSTPVDKASTAAAGEKDVVLVTGASSGLGRASAVEFARRGLRVVATARREEKLREVVDEIVAAGGEAIAVRADVGSEADMEAAYVAAFEAFGAPVKYTFANAGMTGDTGLFLDAPSLDKTLRLWDVNVFGALRTMWAAMRHARAHELSDAAVVVTGSGAATANHALLSQLAASGAMGGASHKGVSYSATKAAVNMLVRTADVIDKSVRVYGINPWLYWSAETGQEEADKTSMFNPVFPGKVGQPRDLAAGVYAMLTNTTAWPRGSVVVFDNNATVSSQLWYDCMEVGGDPDPADVLAAARDSTGREPLFAAADIPGIVKERAAAAKAFLAAMQAQQQGSS